jgi:hypothetical protein
MGVIDTTVNVAIVGGVGYLVYQYYYGGGLCANSIIGATPLCAIGGAIDFFKNQYNTGDAGVPFALETCPDGWSNDGLICREPIGCCGDRDLFGNCYAWNLCGGHLKGRLDNQQCPADHPDKVGLLCYKQCPEGWEHTEAMPYLCRDSSKGNFWDMTGGRLFDNIGKNFQTAFSFL